VSSWFDGLSLLKFGFITLFVYSFIYAVSNGICSSSVEKMVSQWHIREVVERNDCSVV
jgi:hypothetical protein